ncbi:MAG: glycosyltransferase [Planctomycetota bacterium]
MLQGARIAVVEPSLELGGAELQGLLLARHLRANGADVMVFGMGEPGELSRRCAAESIPCVPLPRVESRWAWLAGRRLGHAARIVSAFRPTLLIPFTSAPNVLCGLIAADGGAPAIWNQRDEGLFPQHLAHTQRALRACATWVANGPGSAAWLEHRGIAREHIRVIANAVCPDPAQKNRADWRSELSLPADATVACMLATLSPAKDHVTLLEAWGAVETALPQAWLLLAGGDGGRESALRTQARWRGLTRIRFAGRVADVSGLLGACDLGVLSSGSEGLSNAIFDYRAAGLAIVASDVPGIRAAAHADAVLVPPTQPHALAAAVIDLLGDPQRRSERAQTAAHGLPGVAPLTDWVELIAAIVKVRR